MEIIEEMLKLSLFPLTLSGDWRQKIYLIDKDYFPSCSGSY
uniref:Uncharacterized protein n=1 Tax=Meloidogyne enterolobii TaxID=390850 RepID=A0A6V7V1W7_MELEN|nr:unnamed protein product [Meloidogyne enterolobii]